MIASLGRERGAALFGFLACGAALAVASGAEIWLGLVPCALCLLERRPYQMGAAIGLLAYVLPKKTARPVAWLLVAILVCGAGLSLTHVGVEQHWWPDPLPSCRAPDFTGMTIAQRLAAMPARPAKPCEDPDYLIPGVPVSFTQMGLLYAVGVSAGVAVLLSRKPGRVRRSRV